MYDRSTKCDHSTSVNGPEHNDADWMDANICYQIKNNKNISDFLGIRR